MRYVGVIHEDVFHLKDLNTKSASHPAASHEPSPSESEGKGKRKPVQYPTDGRGGSEGH